MIPSDAQAMEYLRRVKEGLMEIGLSSVDEHLLNGHPAGAVVDMARNTPASLIAMTTHGRSGMGRWVLGSVTDRVVRHSGNPVLVIRAEAGGLEGAGDTS